MGRVPMLDPRLPYYRKGKFSLLGPSKAEHLTFGVGRGPRATLTGQRAMRGPNAEGLPTLAGPSEVVSAARYSLTHEAGFKVINDMIDDLGLDGAADFLRTTVTRRKGGVTTEVSVLQESLRREGRSLRWRQTGAEC